MESFSKTIEGVKYKFEPQQLGNSEEWIYHVSCEDYSFTMRLDKNGEWKIRSKVTFIIKEMEDDFASAIDQKNE
jgi:hypothetical protein